MIPIDFPGRNIVFGEGQPEYQPLPAMLVKGIEQEVITCWELTDEEIDELVKTRKLYLCQYTFGSRLQPILPCTNLGDRIKFE